MRETIRYGFILAVICIVASSLLAGMNSLTRPRIIALAQAEEKATLSELLPEAKNFEPVKSKEGDVIYYKAYDKNGKFAGAAFKAQAKGYSSIIETMVGMTKDGTITAIKIISQNETPGLGAKIAEVAEETTLWEAVKGKKTSTERKSWFQEEFRNKKIEDLKDISAITGATISSQEVIDSVKKKAEEIKELIKDEK